MLNDSPQRSSRVRFNVLKGKNILTGHNEIFEIDDVAVLIWKSCNGKMSIEEMTKKITEEFDVDQESALRDCQAFLGELSEKSFLQ